MMLSFVIPCYNSSQTIKLVINEIEEAVKNCYDYEIICINDDSPDNVYEVLKELLVSDKHIKIIDLSQNFGQHNALMAGINNASGDIIVLADDDGQSPLHELRKLLDALDKGADVVMTTTIKKNHSPIKLIGSKINEIMSHSLIGTPKKMNIVSFYAFKKFIATEMIKYTGSYTYVLGLLYRTTKNIAWVEVNHRKREIGKSNYSFKKMVSLWLNGFTAFSVKPLRIATVLGTITAISGFLYGGYTIVYRLFNTDVLMGYSSLMAALLFIGGVIMMMLGLIGEYIGRIYISLNNAPQYVIREKINFDKDN